MNSTMKTIFIIIVLLKIVYAQSNIDYDKGNDQLRQSFDASLYRIERSGVLANIREKHLGYKTRTNHMIPTDTDRDRIQIRYPDQSDAIGVFKNVLDTSRLFIGGSFAQPPFIFGTETNPQGFEVELVQKIVSEIQLHYSLLHDIRIEWTKIPKTDGSLFSDMGFALGVFGENSNPAVDIIASSLSVTSGRHKYATTSFVYLTQSAVLMSGPRKSSLIDRGIRTFNNPIVQIGVGFSKRRISRCNIGINGSGFGCSYESFKIWRCSYDCW